MTHKYNHSDQVDLMISRLEKNGIPPGEESKMLTTTPHNGKDQFHDLPEAVTEQDIMHLREKLQEIAGTRKPSSKMEDFSFDLSENLLFEEILEETGPEENTVLPDGKPLPRIHLHHHRRVVTESQHQFYLEQMMAGNTIPEEGFDQEFHHDVPGLEDALKENDVMNLRDKLKHISASSVQSGYSAEEIENYLDGEFSPEQAEAFEADMELHPLLNDDVRLYTEVDEALKESDILKMREKLDRLMQSEHSTSRSLQEALAYVDSELTENQRSDFENDLFEQQDLRAEINLLKNLDRAMTEKDIHALRDKLRQVSSQEAQQGIKTGSFLLEPRRSGKLRRNGTYAALFLVLVGFSTLLYNVSGTAPPDYGNYFPAPQTIGAFRSIADVSDPELFRGFEHLNKQQYPEALACFENGLQKNPQNQSARFYSGYIFQKLYRHGDALIQFDQITGAGDNMFIQQAGWYSIWSKIHTAGIKGTLPDLDAIIDRKGFYYKDALALKMILLKEKE